MTKYKEFLAAKTLTARNRSERRSLEGLRAELDLERTRAKFGAVGAANARSYSLTDLKRGAGYEGCSWVGEIIRLWRLTY